MDSKMVEKVAEEIWDHLGLKTKQVVPVTNMRQVNGIARIAIAALTPQWSDEVPTEPGMYIRAWRVVGYWQYSVEQMADGVFTMEGNGHRYTADEIFEGCQWLGPFQPPKATPPEGG